MAFDVGLKERYGFDEIEHVIQRIDVDDLGRAFDCAEGICAMVGIVLNGYLSLKNSLCRRTYRMLERVNIINRV